MPQPDYVIYRISSDGVSVPMVNVNNVQAARIRVTELAQKSVGSSPFMTCGTSKGGFESATVLAAVLANAGIGT